ncbi:MAG: hypothetical protein ACKVRN_17055 [Pyrinomonadaceae bacterium]
MKYRLRFIFAGLAAVIFAVGFLTNLQAQKRGASKLKKGGSAKIAGQVFSHTTAAHREGKYQDCKVCHALPTRNWTSPRADKEAPFPDVRDYPFNEPRTQGSHTTCVGCHQNDFFTPSFCIGCHTAAGNKANARNVRAFPNPANGTQFVTVFPHDAHQDIIASNERKKDIAVGHFVLASFSPIPDDKKNEFYNCAVCHKTATVMPKFKVREPFTVDKSSETGSTYPFGKPTVADNFKPTADDFKTVPMNHASCFTCHYQRIKPISTDCNGCHIFADKRYKPSVVFERSSLKFGHEDVGKTVQVGERVHAKDCMVCHLQTAASSDLQILKNKKEPEVPFSTCSSCHADIIKEEFGKREKDKAFQCNYCHTPVIGRYVKPESHRE